MDQNPQPFGNGQQNQPNYGQPVQPNYQQPNFQQPNYQQPNYQQPNYQQPNYQQPMYQQPIKNPEMPMNWHKFLVYFGLWAGALVNLINGIRVVTGSHYEGYAKLVYAVFPNMKTLDTIFGIILFAVAGLGVFTACSLLAFKKIAPKLVLILYISAFVGSLIYVIGGYATISGIPGADPFELLGSTFAELVVSVVMIIVNYVYYKKREHLFVN